MALTSEFGRDDVPSRLPVTTNPFVSSKARSMRRASFNATKEKKHVALSAILSKTHGIRDLPVRREDDALVVRGKYKQRSGRSLPSSCALCRSPSRAPMSRSATNRPSRSPCTRPTSSSSESAHRQVEGQSSALAASKRLQMCQSRLWFTHLSSHGRGLVIDPAPIDECPIAQTPFVVIVRDMWSENRARKECGPGQSNGVAIITRVSAGQGSAAEHNPCGH
jgi:hypothetical protein